MKRLFTACFAAAFLLAPAACGVEGGAPDSTPADVGFRAVWLTPDGSGAIPDDVARIRLVFFEGDKAPVDRFVTRAGFADMDGDGRPEIQHPGLAVGEVIVVRVEGQLEDGTVAYTGGIGPLVLEPGERRFVDLMLYPVGTVVTLAGAELPPRFLQTATTLADGRVLFAGGFASVEPLALCPFSAPARTRCFDLTASRDAHLFDPTSGRIYPVQGGMVRPRAGHSATALSNGRVLLAGGAPSAVLAFVPQEGGAANGYRVEWHLDDGAHASFEVFVADRNREATDTDRDGFVGSAADASTPGLMDRPRFLHAATPVPGSATQVIVAGGLGEAASASPPAAADTWEVYDDNRSGGFGFYPIEGRQLKRGRPLPAAASLPAANRAFLFGGRIAEDNADLAEVWVPDAGNPGGATQLATEATDGFPGAPSPQYALLRPVAAPLVDGQRALVIGWYGPRCPLTGGANTVFASTPEGTDTELCGPSVGAPRNFVVDGATGATTAFAELRAHHAFAAHAALDDGSLVVAGGFANLQLDTATAAPIETIISTGDATMAPTVTMSRLELASPRAMHAMAALKGRGVVAAGGIRVTSDASDVTLVPELEVLYAR